jgi:hypothetical protein
MGVKITKLKKGKYTSMTAQYPEIITEMIKKQSPTKYGTLIYLPSCQTRHLRIFLRKSTKPKARKPVAQLF